MQLSHDPVHMDPDGQWYFYDQTWANRYGPYPDPDTARKNLSNYIEWLHTQSHAQATAEGKQPERTTDTELELAVKEYMSARDEKAAIAARHKEELQDVQDTLDRLDAFLLGKLQAIGADSVKAGGAVVYTQTELQAGIGDKGALMDHIRATGEVELLQSRVSSTVLKEWMNNNSGNTPPGVTARYERVVRVRKS